MASTYTTNSGIELIATGEQSGTWGDTTNVNLQIIDRLTNGVGEIALSGTTHTLTTSDGLLSDGQYQVLVFGGTPSGTNTVTISPNDQQKFFVVKNNSGQSVVLTQGSGGNVTIANGNSAMVYADGAGAGAVVVDLTATFPAAGALLAANNLSDVDNTATSRINLGLAIGSDVQAFDAQLQAIANLTPDDGVFIVGDGSTFVGESGSTALASIGGVSQTSSTGSAELPAGTTAQRDGLPSAGYFRFNTDESAFEGYDGTEWSGIGGGGAVPNLFSKNDATEVAWTKTGNETAETQTTLNVEVNGAVLTIASGTSIAMPSFSAGTDYAIWAKPDGTLEATNNHTSPPVANARKVGGFHYAPGGNATAQSGGDTTPQINEYSFYDLKWKPACPDPRGMTLVAGGFWVDIYLTGVDAITNGSSAYNVTIADGSSPPKVPTMFGGDGVTTYGGYTWFEAQELATAFGKRTLTQIEFMAATYGTTEETDGGSDPGSTILRSNFTSKWGVMLATGNLYVWGRDRGGEFNTTGWNDNTEGRGEEYDAPNAVLFGGNWSDGSEAGSRCSRWSAAASASSSSVVGSRFACDHLTLE